MIMSPNEQGSTDGSVDRSRGCFVKKLLFYVGGGGLVVGRVRGVFGSAVSSATEPLNCCFLLLGGSSHTRAHAHTHP